MKLTDEQQNVLDEILRFLDSKTHNVFILKGYAGTGKTTLIREILKSLQNEKRDILVAASTGRAAQVLQKKVNDLKYLKPDKVLDGLLELVPVEVKTLHSTIYVFEKIKIKKDNVKKTEDYELSFKFSPNLNKGIMIVDEASMIGDTQSYNSFGKFGSGYLLKDLFVSHPNFQFIFIGDPAQLPPVNQKFSPALTPEYLVKKYQMKVIARTLTKVIRQAEGSGIIRAAQNIRRLYEENLPFILPDGKKNWPKFPIRNIENVFIYPKAKLFNEYIDNIQDFINKYGKNDGLYKSLNHQILINQKNNECFTINNYIREKIHYPSISPSDLQVGDVLQVTQNTYVFGLNNGDFIQILDIGKRIRFAQLNFTSATIRNLSDDEEKNVLLLTDILINGRTNINKYEHKQLMKQFILKIKKEKNITPDDEEFNEYLRTDPYMNAVKATYGYSITCHKSQGGEWKNVYIHTTKSIVSISKPYNWLYTAITRAQNNVFLNDGWYFI